MILVTGATGQLGRAVIRNLLKQMPAGNIVAFVRDTQKAADLQAQGVEIRVGDYDTLPAIEAAVQGIEKVLLISGGDAHNAVKRHRMW